MTLLEVKAYLVEHHRAALSDIATHFDTSPDAARQVLGHWLAKGKVTVHKPESCPSACHCSSPPDEIYQWVG
jgi:hypothetical protein